MHTCSYIVCALIMLGSTSLSALITKFDHLLCKGRNLSLLFWSIQVCNTMSGRKDSRNNLREVIVAAYKFGKGYMAISKQSESIILQSQRLSLSGKQLPIFPWVDIPANSAQGQTVMLRETRKGGKEVNLSFYRSQFACWILKFMTIQTEKEHKDRLVGRRKSPPSENSLAAWLRFAVLCVKKREQRPWNK